MKLFHHQIIHNRVQYYYLYCIQFIRRTLLLPHTWKLNITRMTLSLLFQANSRKLYKRKWKKAWLPAKDIYTSGKFKLTPTKRKPIYFHIITLPNDYQAVSKTLKNLRIQKKVKYFVCIWKRNSILQNILTKYVKIS